MTQPLALVLYEKLLPGSQLVNRLQDLNYRVQTINDADLVLECAQQSKPLLVLADLESSGKNVLEALSRLRQNSATKHLPIIGFSREDKPELRVAAQEAGLSLLVTEAAIMNHLPQLLDQALDLT